MVLAAFTVANAAPQAGYVDTRVCAPCHSQIYESWRKTPMARSLQRLTADNSIEDFTTRNRFYHRASDTWFEMLRRNGRYYQRRWQIGFVDQETNVD